MRVRVSQLGFGELPTSNQKKGAHEHAFFQMCRLRAGHSEEMLSSLSQNLKMLLHLLASQLKAVVGRKRGWPTLKAAGRDVL